MGWSLMNCAHLCAVCEGEGGGGGAASNCYVTVRFFHMTLRLAHDFGIAVNSYSKPRVNGHALGSGISYSCRMGSGCRGWRRRRCSRMRACASSCPAPPGLRSSPACCTRPLSSGALSSHLRVPSGALSGVLSVEQYITSVFKAARSIPA